MQIATSNFYGFLRGSLLGLFLVICSIGADAAVTTTCSAPTVTAPTGGGTSTIIVDCTLTGTAGEIAAGRFLRTNNQNRVSTGTPSITLTRTTTPANTLSAALQTSSVTSPNGSVTAITGTTASFNGSIQSNPATVRFQYTVTTIPTTLSGTYQSGATAFRYTWRVKNSAGTTLANGVTGGTRLILSVPSVPTSVTCTSPSVNAPAGGGSFTLNVDCVLSGSQGTIRPSAGNKFSPTSLTLTNGASTLNATLQSTVTSPNSTVGSITGTASGGFTGTVTSFPATVRAQYTGTTTSTTKSGTYTSGTITYTWATL